MAGYVGLFTCSVLHEDLTSERTRPFVQNVPPTFAAAEGSEGFICRGKGNYHFSEPGKLEKVTYDKVPSFYTDPGLVVQTLSVWNSIDSAWKYVYSGVHVEALRKRAEWMQKPIFPQYVLWWRETDSVPLYAEGVQHLEHLYAHGATKGAFTFRNAYEHDGTSVMVQKVSV